MYTSITQCMDKIASLRAIHRDEVPLAKTRKLLSVLGDPHKKVKYIHVAGSNGKGSTITMLSAMLRGAGLSVGVFTSPHLERVNERIVLNGFEITDDDFITYMNRLDEVINANFDGEYPSFFEVLTLIAFLYFSIKKPDVVLLETGLGGRLDATNVVMPLVSIITTISLEHTAILGDTYAKIATEKAGIIKANTPVVSGVANAEAAAVIADKAQAVDAPLYVITKDVNVKNIRPQQMQQFFDYRYGDTQWQDIALSMQGLHQVVNAGVAIKAVEVIATQLGMMFDEKIVKTALANVAWPGRFEAFTNHIILDGAHNVEGVTALLSTLKSAYPNHPFDVLYASLDDKDYKTNIALLEAQASSMIFTSFDAPNAVSILDLQAACTHDKSMLAPRWQDVVKQPREGRLLVVTGSLYFIAEVRHLLAHDMEGENN